MNGLDMMVPGNGRTPCGNRQAIGVIVLSWRELLGSQHVIGTTNQRMAFLLRMFMSGLANYAGTFLKSPQRPV